MDKGIVRSAMFIVLLLIILAWCMFSVYSGALMDEQGATSMRINATSFGLTVGEDGRKDAVGVTLIVLIVVLLALGRSVHRGKFN